MRMIVDMKFGETLEKETDSAVFLDEVQFHVSLKRMMSIHNP
jgi:hypothetical protein